MLRERIIQLISTVIVIGAFMGAGVLLPRIIEKSDESALRYTDISIEGAPPIVALGTAIGALRGLVVDYLWLKVNAMKEKGLFYEVMSDADMITKLQPRFGEVWGFHGHNMAYNISVMTHTPEERWDWVNAGIDLVRNRGLRYNPNDLILHKELAWWLAHKVDGLSDDAHLHYKREFARDWHLIMGPPPYDYEDRVEWMRQVADAPETLEEAISATPKLEELIDKLKEDLFEFDMDKKFLMTLGEGFSIKTSPYAQLIGLDDRFKQNDPLYARFDEILTDPENAEALGVLLTYLRKKVLREEYNMDPQLMYEYTRDTGPLDWRHPQAHALYWSRKGSEFAQDRFQNEDDIYKILNNDRIQIQAMQALARTGLMTFDPYSNDNPGRLNDTRWITVLDRYFRSLYDEHYEVRGAGSDTFADMYKNFMTSAVRELYRAGEIEQAQQILDELDTLFGRGGLIPNNTYAKPLDVFVQETTLGEYEMQPEVARSDVFMALRRGFREGLLLGNEQVLQDALEFARDLTIYFKENQYNKFVNKFGEERMAALLGSLDRSVEDVFTVMMLDTSMPLIDRLRMYARAPDEQKQLVYDNVSPVIEKEFELSPLVQAITFEQAMPEPPGMEAVRARRAREAQEREAQKTERAEVERN